MDTAVGPHPGDRILSHVAVSAVELQTLVDDASFAVGEPVLGHGGCGIVELAVDEPLYAVVEEQPSDPCFGRALSELESRVLKLDERVAECGALFDVTRRQGNGALGG